MDDYVEKLNNHPNVDDNVLTIFIHFRNVTIPAHTRAHVHTHTVHTHTHTCTCTLIHTHMHTYSQPPPDDRSFTASCTMPRGGQPEENKYVRDEGREGVRERGREREREREKTSTDYLDMHALLSLIHVHVYILLPYFSRPRALVGKLRTCLMVHQERYIFLAWCIDKSIFVAGYSIVGNFRMMQNFRIFHMSALYVKIKTTKI